MTEYVLAVALFVVVFLATQNAVRAAVLAWFRAFVDGIAGPGV